MRHAPISSTSKEAKSGRTQQAQMQGCTNAKLFHTGSRVTTTAVAHVQGAAAGSQVNMVESMTFNQEHTYSKYTSPYN